MVKHAMHYAGYFWQLELILKQRFQELWCQLPYRSDEFRELYAHLVSHCKPKVPATLPGPFPGSTEKPIFAALLGSLVGQ